jgi:hypothetical protein
VAEDERADVKRARERTSQVATSVIITWVVEVLGGE